MQTATRKPSDVAIDVLASDPSQIDAVYRLGDRLAQKARGFDDLGALLTWIADHLAEHLIERFERSGGPEGLLAGKLSALSLLAAYGVATRGTAIAFPFPPENE